MRQDLSWALAGGEPAAGSDRLAGLPARGQPAGACVDAPGREGCWGQRQQYDAGRGRHDDGGDEQPEVHARHQPSPGGVGKRGACGAGERVRPPR